jgi:hypothetical protein
MESLIALALIVFALAVPLILPFWLIGLGIYLRRLLDRDSRKSETGGIRSNTPIGGQP